MYAEPGLAGSCASSDTSERFEILESRSGRDGFRTCVGTRLAMGVISSSSLTGLCASRVDDGVIGIASRLRPRRCVGGSTSSMRFLTLSLGIRLGGAALSSTDMRTELVE